MGLTQTRAADNGISWGGILLFLIGVLLATSADDDLRIYIGPLRMHACLIPLAIVGPLLFLSRLHSFPWKILVALAAFALFFSLSSIGSNWGIIAKLLASEFTLVSSALLIRTRADILAGALGMCLSTALLGLVGLLSVVDAEVGVLAFGTNKNVYSLFALPALVLAGNAIVRPGNIALRILFSFCAAAIVTTIVLSANRSGWLGVAVIALLLCGTERLRGSVVVVTLGLAITYFVINYADTTVYSSKLQQIAEGKTADQLRLQVLTACIQIGIDYPIAGVSPDALPFAIGRHLGVENTHGPVSAHNIVGFLIGGCGLVCFTAFVILGITLWNVHPSAEQCDTEDVDFRAARRILRMMIVVWIVRGLFTEEILYNPSFCMALGMSLGACLIREKTSAKALLPVTNIPVYDAQPLPT